MTIDSFHGEYRWLSNFWPSSFVIDNICWPTVEHYYQAHKTVVPAERFAVLALEKPGQVKRFGKKLTLRPDWTDETKLDIMRLAVLAKFDQNPDLAALLLATGEEELIEGNRWGDHFWGVSRWGEGHNHLGRILMSVRDELREDWDV